MGAFLIIAALRYTVTEVVDLGHVQLVLDFRGLTPFKAFQTTLPPCYNTLDRRPDGLKQRNLPMAMVPMTHYCERLSVCLANPRDMDPR